MTLSFGDLVEQPSGTLVYTTSDGSMTFDERLAGPHHQPIWGYDAEPLDGVMVKHKRTRYKNFFDEWQRRKHTDIYTAFINIANQIQPTMPVGLLLNSIYVYVAAEFETGTSSAYVEMFVDGRVQFIKLNVHNFFAHSKYRFKADHDGNIVEALSDPLDDLNEFNLFKTARLLLQ